MKALRRRFLVPCTLFLIALAGMATAAEADRAWRAGEAAYADGDYRAALDAFKESRRAGRHGAAVYYNIAVCEYRLGDYAAARETFRELDARFPAMRPLARYNLGLVALKLGERESAADFFRASYHLADDDPNLRALASTALRRLIDDAPTPASWVRVFSLRSGFDDNVILRDDPGLTGGQSADSPFVEAFGTLRGPYAGDTGLRFDGGAFVLRYPDADAFDQSTVYAGGLYEWNLDGWQAELAAHLGASTLGGDSFDRTFRVDAQLMRRLDARNGLMLRYRYEDIAAGDDIFAGVEGSRQRLELGWRWYEGLQSLRVSLRRETNDREDPGVSPDKTRLRGDYRYAPDRGWGFGASLELRASEYSGQDLDRDEDLVQAELTLTRHFDSGWEIFGQLLRAENDSTDPAFDYSRNQVAIGVFRVF